MTRFYLTALAVLGTVVLLAQEPFLVADIFPGDASGQNYSRPENFVAFGDRLLFTADAPFTDIELYVTDGTEAGTRRLTNINPTNSFQNIETIQPLGIIGDKFYHTGREPQFGWELYETDLTTEQTRRLSDIHPGAGNAEPRGGTVLNGELLFTAATSTRGREWFKYVPAQDTIVFLGDVNPGTGTGSPTFGGAHVFNGRAYYQGTSPATGFEIFATDGTAEGTGIFYDGRPGPENPFGVRYEFVNFKGDLYLPYYTNAQGAELGRTTDGTAATLERVASTNFGGRHFGHGPQQVVEQAATGVSRGVHHEGLVQGAQVPDLAVAVHDVVGADGLGKD